VTVRFSTPRPIAAADDVDKFDCGEPDLNEWLRKRALANHTTGATRTFVTTPSGEDRVVGYYALAAAGVKRSDVPKGIGNGQPSMIPVILLARLGVDQNHQGLGLGAQLLRDAIARTVSTSEQVGVRAMLVHAMHDRARDFYVHFEFEASPTDPLHLYLLMQDARAAMGHLHS
jgi:GNAT superfamily N-acetyltransferase